MTSLIKERRRGSPRPAPHFTTATPRTLFEGICDVIGVNVEEAKGKCRDTHLVKARAIFAYLGREMKFPCTEMGKQVNRDHATILSHHKAYRNYLDESKPWFRPELKEEIEGVKHRLRVRLINC